MVCCSSHHSRSISANRSESVRSTLSKQLALGVPYKPTVAMLKHLVSDTPYTIVYAVQD